MTPKVRNTLKAERDRLRDEISRLQGLVYALDQVLEEKPEARGEVVMQWPVSAPAPAVPEEPEVPEPLPELVDAATLAPLTPIQFKVFSAFVAAKGEYLSASQIDDRCAKNGAFGSLSAVRDKGYLVGRPTPGRARNQLTYHVACFGAPRVLEDGFALRGHHPSGKKGEPWKAPETAKVKVSTPIFVPKDDPPPPEARVEPREVEAAPAPPPKPAPPQEPAQAAQPKKIYPAVTSLRKQAPLPARAAHVPGSNTATQQAFGADGNGGRAQDGADGRIKVSTYLIRKGHSVTPARGGAWQVDGRIMDRHEVLELINSHRAKAEVPPAVIQDLE